MRHFFSKCQYVNTNCTMQCMHTYLLTSDGQIMQASLATHHQVKIDALKQMCEKVVKNRMHHLHSPVSLEINRVIYNPCPLYYVVTNHLTWDNTTTYQVEGGHLLSGQIFLALERRSLLQWLKYMQTSLSLLNLR